MSTVIHLLTLLVISWQDNDFEGTLPPATWTKLAYFYVGDNFFTGTLSESIGSFSQLTFFRIENNRFTGTLPSSIGLWTQLKEFYTAGDSPPGNTLDFEVSTFSIHWYLSNWLSNSVTKESFRWVIAKLHWSMVPARNFSNWNRWRLFI